MSSVERRLVFFGMTLLILTFGVWIAGGGRFPTKIAQASSHIPNCIVFPDGGCYNEAYYGADISSSGAMYEATGVQPVSSNTPPNNGPWPQYVVGNYCFLAAVQALSNYEYWVYNGTIPFPHQINQGPSNDIPSSALQNPIGPDGRSYQILYDMEHSLAAVSNAIGYTKADISGDFGGDPRAQAVGAYAETPSYRYYHQYIYHNGRDGAAYGLAKGVAFSHSHGGNSPEIAIVNQGQHSVIVAGVWSYGNPSSISDAGITGFAVYNPENQGAFTNGYMNGAYYQRVTYSDWVGTSPVNYKGVPSGGSWYWWGEPYASIGGADPDPSIGMYATGPGTNYPNAHFWLTHYVSIQRDDDSSDSDEYAHDENGYVMTYPY